MPNAHPYTKIDMAVLAHRSSFFNVWNVTACIASSSQSDSNDLFKDNTGAFFLEYAINEDDRFASMASSLNIKIMICMLDRDRGRSTSLWLD